MPKSDVQVENMGTIFAFVPQTRTAQSWFARNVQAETWQWSGGQTGLGALMVEHRYALDICDALLDEGLTVQNA